VLSDQANNVGLLDWTPLQDSTPNNLIFSQVNSFPSSGVIIFMMKKIKNGLKTKNQIPVKFLNEGSVNS